MTTDPTRAIGAALPATTSTWGPDDVILYHLGLNIGAAPRDLRYVYEDGLTVLPTFGVIPALPTAARFGDVDGMDLDRSGEVHGEHEITLHAPLPVAATATTTGRIAAVHDKGSAAVVVLDTQTHDADGRLLCRNRFTAFLRGAGGFGGASDPPRTPAAGGERPDRVVTTPTLPQQALLYRLSGDRNPLHADPAAARRVGFDRPILHGLSTFGVVFKAVVDALLDGDGLRVRRYRVRFAGALYPGETVETSIWARPDGYALTAVAAERGTPVLSGGFVEVVPEGTDA